MKFYGIKQKLIIQFGILVILLSLVLSIFSYSSAKRILTNTTNNILPEISKQSSKLVSTTLEKNLLIGKDVANIPMVSEDQFSLEEKLKVIEPYMETADLLSIGIGDLNGTVNYTTGTQSQIGNETFYQKALKGNANVSEPRMSQTLKKLVISYAVPITNKDKQVISVLVYSKESDEIGKLIESVKFLNTGSGFMINSDGTLIADPDQESVINQLNFIEKAKTDSSYANVGKAVETMLKNKEGITEYSFGGEKKNVTYTEVEGTDWILAIIVSSDDILSGVKTMRNQSLIIAFIGILASIVVIILLATKMSSSIKDVCNKLNLIAEGNFDIQVDSRDMNKKDEIGLMFKAIDSVKKSVGTMILDVKSVGKHVGSNSEELLDFSDELSTSMDNISSAISEIAQVNSGQAHDISNISKQVEDFSAQLDTLGDYINSVQSGTYNIEKVTTDSKGTVKNLEESVNKFDSEFILFRKNIEKLGDDVNEVNSITTIINELSEQTNLLALNAAIEAARAGEAGKGFAVVADEIRLLAEQSKNNSDKITSIIKSSYENTRNIVDKSREMNKELQIQNSNINDVKNVFDGIVDSVDSVLPELTKMYDGITQVKENQQSIISSVTNALAVSEEVAASSEEISALSNELQRGSSDIKSLSEKLSENTVTINNHLDKFVVSETASDENEEERE